MGLRQQAKAHRKGRCLEAAWRKGSTQRRSSGQLSDLLSGQRDIVSCCAVSRAVPPCSCPLCARLSAVAHPLDKEQGPWQRSKLGMRPSCGLSQCTGVPSKLLSAYMRRDRKARQGCSMPRLLSVKSFGVFLITRRRLIHFGISKRVLSQCSNFPGQHLKPLHSRL